MNDGRAKIPENQAVELYHIARDVGEQNDLAASESMIADRIRYIIKNQVIAAAITRAFVPISSPHR